jgi:hypothetical protein
MKALIPVSLILLKEHLRFSNVLQEDSRKIFKCSSRGLIRERSKAFLISRQARG